MKALWNETRGRGFDGGPPFKRYSGCTCGHLTTAARRSITDFADRWKEWRRYTKESNRSRRSDPSLNRHSHLSPVIAISFCHSMNVALVEVTASLSSISGQLIGARKRSGRHFITSLRCRVGTHFLFDVRVYFWYHRLPFQRSAQPAELQVDSRMAMRRASYQHSH